MVRKYQLGGKPWYVTNEFNNPAINTMIDEMYPSNDGSIMAQVGLSTNPNDEQLVHYYTKEEGSPLGHVIEESTSNSIKGMGSNKAGALAGGLQAASSMFGQFNNIFNNKNSNEYMTYDDNWAGIVSNSNRRRQGVDAVNAQLQDYSGMNSINDFFAAFGGYQPKSFAVGGHISGVRPLDDNNVAGSVGTAIATDATKGAAIGTQIMPGWGTLIGAAVGTVAGATRGGIGAAQAKKNVGYLNNAIDKVNYMNDINRDNQISTIMNRMNRSWALGGNLFQYGGDIDPMMMQYKENEIYDVDENEYERLKSMGYKIEVI